MYFGKEGGVAEWYDLSVLGDFPQVLPVLDRARLLGVVLQAANHIHDVLILEHDLKYGV